MCNACVWCMCTSVQVCTSVCLWMSEKDSRYPAVTLDSIIFKKSVSLSLEIGWGPSGPKDFPSGAFTMLGL